MSRPCPLDAEVHRFMDGSTLRSDCERLRRPSPQSPARTLPLVHSRRRRVTTPTVRRLAPQVYVLGGGPEDWRMINSPGRPMLTDCDRPSRRSTSVSAITRPTSRGA